MVIELIFKSFLDKLDRLLSCVGGFVMLSLSIIANFFCGYKLAFIGVGVCIFLDAVFGISAAISQNRFARSELLRNTIIKFAAYGAALVVLAFVEKLFSMDVPYCVNAIAALICCTELLSIAGNVLIIQPNFVFFKLLKPALKGEIASKLKISEDDVEEALEAINNKKSNKTTKK